MTSFKHSRPTCYWEVKHVGRSGILNIFSLQLAVIPHHDEHSFICHLWTRLCSQSPVGISVQYNYARCVCVRQPASYLHVNLLWTNFFSIKSFPSFTEANKQ